MPFTLRRRRPRTGCTVIGGIGYGLLVIALVTSLVAVVTSIYGARARSAAMLETARRSALVTFPLLTISVITLLYLLVSGHFEYAYVYQTTDLAMPLYLKLAALWGGQEGSLLFWCWLLRVSPSWCWYENGRQSVTCCPGSSPSPVLPCYFSSFSFSFSRIPSCDISSPWAVTWSVPCSRR